MMKRGPGKRVPRSVSSGCSTRAFGSGRAWSMGVSASPIFSLASCSALSSPGNRNPKPRLDALSSCFPLLLGFFAGRAGQLCLSAHDCHWRRPPNPTSPLLPPGCGEPVPPTRLGVGSAARRLSAHASGSDLGPHNHLPVHRDSSQAQASHPGRSIAGTPCSSQGSINSHRAEPLFFSAKSAFAGRSLHVAP